METGYTNLPRNQEQLSVFYVVNNSNLKVIEVNRVYPKTANQAKLITKFQKYAIVLSLGLSTVKTYTAVANEIKLVLSRQESKLVLQEII